ncbi:phospholipase [Pseudolysobacter antarcticus]|uniref:Phospholipase n=1 Tax=Pseudolysobacter antarcticus TaxID=2511995 RepID=A0A411HHF0_9GAMM|nr:alkaline phosphatase family protein [Pseudolysobacter antarcticus]QBB69946.1 phospholipase [Pseudolysobacter antarcticus]
MRKKLAVSIALAIGSLFQIGALADTAQSTPTSTPIKHIVVIFQENVSFDHYFGTYPHAANLTGEPPFYTLSNTPTVNGLSGTLLTNNPTALNTANAEGAANPFRLSPAQASTADQDHDYTPEQQALHFGMVDLYPAFTGAGGTASGAPAPANSPAIFTTSGLVMGYYDGNTVTALWNYAQYFAMSDNSYNTGFGPSTPGALNLISGQTNGVIANLNGTGDETDDGHGGLTVIADPDPIGDVCSPPTANQVTMGGKNIGDALNAAGVTWGFFSGGFDLGVTNSNGTTGCNRSTTSVVTNVKKKDYIPHHQPFQYYASTANPTHARPTSQNTIGHAGDAANHQYDINDFFVAAGASNLPAVSYLKAPGYQDGHAGYSDPIDEQQFVVHVLNYLQSLPEWRDTLVVIAYDDSDGWYDHQMPPIVNQSSGLDDALTGVNACGNGLTALPGVLSGVTHAQGRCGYGPRLPLLVISPWSKSNYVDHTVTDQTSILRFVEDNWLAGQRLGQGSFDSIANPIDNMLDFSKTTPNPKLFLDINGQPPRILQNIGKPVAVAQ